MLSDVELRANIYKSFSVEGNNIICKLKDGTKVTFENGELLRTISNNNQWSLDNACLGLQMVEEAFGAAKLREIGIDVNDVKLIDLDMLYSGNPITVVSELCDNCVAKREYIFGYEDLQNFAKKHKIIGLSVNALFTTDSSHDLTYAGIDTQNKFVLINNTQVSTALTSSIKEGDVDNLRFYVYYLD